MIYQISLVYLNHYYFVIFQAGFGRHYLKLDALRSVKEQRFKCENVCPKMLKIYKTWSTTNLILTHNEAFHWRALTKGKQVFVFFKFDRERL